MRARAYNQIHDGGEREGVFQKGGGALLCRELILNVMCNKSLRRMKLS